jgi:hypothetical protein
VRRLACTRVVPIVSRLAPTAGDSAMGQNQRERARLCMAGTDVPAVPGFAGRGRYPVTRRAPPIRLGLNLSPGRSPARASHCPGALHSARFDMDG